MKVNDEGEGLVFAVAEQEIEHISERQGLAFSWSSDLFSASANDTVLLVQNTSKTHDLHIEFISLSNGTTASEWTIHVISSATTPTGDGATITGFCLNTGKSEVAEAVAIVDETANSSEGTVVGTRYLVTDTNIDVDTHGLILTTNAAVAIDVVTGSTAMSATVTGFYKVKSV